VEPVEGEACLPVVVPERLNFGALQATRRLRRALEARPTSEAGCVYDVRIEPVKDAACIFWLALREPLEAGGERLVVEVEALETGCGPCAAELVLSAGAETRAIPLSGVAARGTLVLSSPDVSLGRGPPDVLRTADVMLENPFREALTLTGWQLAPEDAGFAASGPREPLRLEPGARAEWQVGFRGSTAGWSRAHILVEGLRRLPCGGEARVAPKIELHAFVE
jgi:hypothetical protein